MSPTINKVIYKPDSTSTDEFIAILSDVNAYKKWLGKEGDKSIPLVEIVDAFDVFHSGQGAQGLLNRPSKQELETVFGTSNDTEVIKIVLEKGRLESSDGQPLKFSSKNDNRGGSNHLNHGSHSGGHAGR
ncbi:ribosome maturation protein [Melampsora americana]|nr:ribosome maturation protein [Melampsora americana]